MFVPSCSRRSGLIRLLVPAMFAAVLLTPEIGTSQGQSPRQFRPSRVIPPQRAITDASVIKADEVRGQVSGGELVIGVVINGEARAYPINMLTGPMREIINDSLGGHPIAATWCHLCHTGVVYSRKAGKRTLTLAVSGMLWKRNLVMIDEETRSLWSHLLGEAMQGPLNGTELKAIPSEMATWESWKRKHPETTALNLSRSSRNYVKEFYRRPHDFVFGWVVDGQAYAAGFEILLKYPVANMKLKREIMLVTFDKESTAAHLFSSEVDDRTLEFMADGPGRMRDTQTKTIWNANTGEALDGPLKGSRLKQRVGIVAYKRIWDAFHPDSVTVRLSE